MISNKEVLKRLSGVEKKLAATAEEVERKKGCDDVNVLLQMREYFQKRQEMTMAREEIHKPDEEDAKQTIERYHALQKLSPEEQKAENRRAIDDGVARARAWLNSDNRRQFDRQYAEYQKQRNANPASEMP